jgi:hypothetical protein
MTNPIASETPGGIRKVAEGNRSGPLNVVAPHRRGAAVTSRSASRVVHWFKPGALTGGRHVTEWADATHLVSFDPVRMVSGPHQVESRRPAIGGPSPQETGITTPRLPHHLGACRTVVGFISR